MSNKNIPELFEELKINNQIFLNYLRAKFPLFHNSNFFSKDLQYGIIGYFEKKGISINYEVAEELSKLLSDYYVNQGVFTKTSQQGWKVNYPEFVTSKPGDPFSY